MSKFKSANGSLLYKPLFLEFSRDEDKDRVLYTIKDEDVSPEIISLKRRYLEQNDISEYTFASLYFKDYNHWDQLTKFYWFAPIVDKWRKELEVKIRSEALLRLVKISQSDSPQSAQVNKYLAEGKWKMKPQKDKKYPKSKKEKDGLLSMMDDISFNVDKDFDRLIKKGN